MTHLLEIEPGSSASDQPSPERADEVLLRHDDVVEEHLVGPEQVAGERRGPADLDARRVVGHEQQADAAVAVARGSVRTYIAIIAPGQPGAGAPHLLAVDHEVVAARRRRCVRSAATSEPASGSEIATENR